MSGVPLSSQGEQVKGRFDELMISVATEAQKVTKKLNINTGTNGDMTQGFRAFRFGKDLKRCVKPIFKN